MAEPNVVQINNIYGTLGSSLTNSGTTITFGSAPTGLGSISSPSFAKLVLEPNSANFEIVYVTSYAGSGTTATIVRGQEGTSGVAHSNGVTWIHAATVADFQAAVYTGTAPASAGALDAARFIR